MERLTIQTIKNIIDVEKTTINVFEKHKEPTYLDRCILSGMEELKQYRIAEEQGLLLRLPCPLGTVVYNIHWWDDVEEKVKVDGKTYYRKVHKHKVSKGRFCYTDIDEFGKTVFLTKAEAEEALQKLKGE